MLKLKRRIRKGRRAKERRYRFSGKGWLPTVKALVRDIGG